MRTTTTALGVVLLLSTPAIAQDPLGKKNGATIDVSQKLALALGSVGVDPWGNKCLGAVLDRSGNFWVSVGFPVPAIAGIGKLAKFDVQGTFVRAVDQPALAASVFGLRDLCYDGKDTIYGGCDAVSSGNVIFAFDIVSETFLPAKNWKAPGGYLVHRGLAFDPLGNGGAGSIYVSEFGVGPITEFDKGGVVLRTIPSQSSATGTYGLALDVVRRRLWTFSQTGCGNPNGCVVGTELDLTGQPTGVVFYGDTQLGGLPVAGGIEFHARNSKPTLVLVNQGLNGNWVYEIGGTFEYGASCGGRIGMRGDAPYSGNQQFGVTLAGSSVPALAALMMNFVPGYFPVHYWPFGPTCDILLGVTPLPYAFGSLPIQGGAAFQPIPIPVGVVGQLYFQWVEYDVTANPPMYLSNGGKTAVGY